MLIRFLSHLKEIMYIFLIVGVLLNGTCIKIAISKRNMKQKCGLMKETIEFIKNCQRMKLKCSVFQCRKKCLKNTYSQEFA